MHITYVHRSTFLQNTFVFHFMECLWKFQLVKYNSPPYIFTDLKIVVKSLSTTWRIVWRIKKNTDSFRRWIWYSSNYVLCSIHSLCVIARYSLEVLPCPWLHWSWREKNLVWGCLVELPNQVCGRSFRITAKLS